MMCSGPIVRSAVSNVMLLPVLTWVAPTLDPPLGRIAGDEGRVERANRDAPDPVRVQVGLGQRLIDAALVGAQRAAALQQQRDALEVGANLRAVRLGARCGGGVHGCF